jgi:hypothetical protein
MNEYGPVISLSHLEMVLRQNMVEEDSTVGSGNAKQISRTIKLPPGSLANAATIAALPYNTIFHESIHAVEEQQGETSWSWTAEDWSERNAYWVERHSSVYVPTLRAIENSTRAGNLVKAREAVDALRQLYALGVPESNGTYPRPDPTGMTLLRAAGFNFDLEAAIREIERRTGVTF